MHMTRDDTSIIPAPQASTIGLLVQIVLNDITKGKQGNDKY
jgi:hypothetical protein